jgi:hypothetical protein
MKSNLFKIPKVGLSVIHACLPEVRQRREEVGRNDEEFDRAEQ